MSSREKPSVRNECIECGKKYMPHDMTFLLVEGRTVWVCDDCGDRYSGK